MSECMIPVATGELADKITILEIKSERITDPAKLGNVRRELDALRKVWSALGFAGDASVAQLCSQLKSVNEALWEIEDDIRVLEAKRQFDSKFIELARAVYHTNDKRAALKREINTATGSALVEEKDYVDYAGGGET
ncbi:MAG: hypothetical protein JJU27_07735 [Gammaproteobacteria bacterium]|nr:hypothetical protein [Gammaproteobacteria bacterium]